MINEEKVLKQIERELSRAKQASDSETRRAHMRAISSLTELVLDDSETEDTQKAATVQPTDAETLELQKMIGNSYQPHSKTPTSKPKNDADPYGQGSGSLLDF